MANSGGRYEIRDGKPVLVRRTGETINAKATAKAPQPDTTSEKSKPVKEPDNG